MGIYLSAHPLDDYSVVLNSMCNTHCAELGDKPSLAKKENIVFGGIITGVKSKFTKKGNPCGFVTIEDFEGSGELALFGEDWGQWKGMFTEGCTDFVTAKCQSRYGNDQYLDFKVSSVEYLQTVKEKKLDKLTITIDSDIINDTLVSDLSTLLARDNEESRTQLFLRIHEVESNDYILMRAQDKTVNVDKNLIQFIEDNPKMSYSIN